MKKNLVFAVLALGVGLLFSCSNTDDLKLPEPSWQEESSSSSLPPEMAFCRFSDGTCAPSQVPPEVCTSAGGLSVQSCGGSSSSSSSDVASSSDSAEPSSSSDVDSSSDSAEPSSSSDVASSSDSAEPSSSSALQSSSSAVLTSSSSLSSETTYCKLPNGTCTQSAVSLETCSTLGGTPDQSCAVFCRRTDGTCTSPISAETCDLLGGTLDPSCSSWMTYCKLPNGTCSQSAVSLGTCTGTLGGTPDQSCGVVSSSSSSALPSSSSEEGSSTCNINVYNYCLGADSLWNVKSISPDFQGGKDRCFFTTSISQLTASSAVLINGKGPTTGGGCYDYWELPCLSNLSKADEGYYIRVPSGAWVNAFAMTAAEPPCYPISCGGTPYDPAKKFCFSDVLYDKCGTATFNPPTQLCSGNKIHNKCGSDHYDPAIKFCSDNIIYDRCGGTGATYTPGTEECCGSSKYALASQFCLGNNIYGKCGGDDYSPVTEYCKGGVITPTPCEVDRVYGSGASAFQVGNCMHIAVSCLSTPLAFYNDWPGGGTWTGTVYCSGGSYKSITCTDVTCETSACPLNTSDAWVHITETTGNGGQFRVSCY